MDLGFLSQFADSDSTATVMVLLPDGTVSQIHNVSPFAIIDKCPLLYHAFEFGAGSVRQASIDATSRSAVVSLLRFLYTGDYVDAERDGQPCSFLTHAEAFKIAEDFDVPELQVSAYVNFTRETEMSCCMAVPPSDLCDTIKFLYEHLASHKSRQEQSLLDTLLNYCLSIFKYQGLGEREDFRQIVFENPAFHKDLCRTSMNRGFEDEGALDIVRLPVSAPTPHSSDKWNKRALGDFQFELWQDSEEPAPTSDAKLESPTKRLKSDVGGLFNVVYRPKDQELFTFSESESDSDPDSPGDENGFTLVHRPKLNVDVAIKDETLSSIPSSPELLSPDPVFRSIPAGESSFEPTVKVEPEDAISTSTITIKAERQTETLLSSPVKIESQSDFTSVPPNDPFEDDWDFLEY